MTQRDGTEREVGGGFRMGNMCIPVADSSWCTAKPIQYCKVINLQLNKFIFLKNPKKTLLQNWTLPFLLWLQTKSSSSAYRCPFSMPSPLTPWDLALDFPVFLPLTYLTWWGAMDTEMMKIWPLPDEDREMHEGAHGRPTEHTGPHSSLRPIHEKLLSSATWPSAQDLSLFPLCSNHLVWALTCNTHSMTLCSVCCFLDWILRQYFYHIHHYICWITHIIND